MKSILSLIFVLYLSSIGFSQSLITSSKLLTKKEVHSIFTNSVKTKLEIENTIYKTYEYNDREGKHFIVMIENNLNCKGSKKCSDAIKAYCFSYKNGLFSTKWKLNDFILPKDNEVPKEHAIYFWTKYLKLKDFDNDGLIEPVIVYGTLGMNGKGDGRIKILIYHHGKKRAIRHQNGTLDYERNTQVDKLFYKLPKEIQNSVTDIIHSINENSHGIFPHGWQDAMKNKKLKFDETL
ncbi:hypothetical protein MHM83_16015 [Tenacibaculum sp. Mcav3-52]|uniref:M949_RS01915 family surface polysaccharide biosynthesis protein n=1 Tax=Tenacibaculum sp. Mcav3-52 TaxID=2917762 RepID=UPI001EF25CA4|nr:hypothetical protein [Tenacibaculum sp. Mcav3-52]MCG7503374.1 hypothetical protein [Tenacibaculum sp. Mcav3-52]